MHSECIATKAGVPDVECLKSIASRLLTVTEIWTIDRVVCESFIGSKSATAAKSLGYVQGLVVGMCIALGLPCTYHSAVSVKNKLTGSKNADKDEVLASVLKLFPELETFMKGKNKEIQWAMSDSCALFVCG